MQALVIDDSRAMRRIVCRILADLGFTTVEAADGRAALDVGWPVTGAPSFVRALSLLLNLGVGVVGLALDR